MRRLCVPGARLERGAELRLDAARSRRLRNVLRMRPGDALAVFDGRGAERAARVEDLGADLVALRLGEAIAPLPEPPVAVALACAFPRGQRGDWIVEKATELGVAAIAPLPGARSVLRPGEGRLGRWRRIAIAAAEQCGRASLPAIGGAPPPGALRLLADPAAGRGVAAAVAAAGPAAVAILVGPEGGWSPAERDRLVAEGARPVSLGPLRLRAETAAIAAAVQALAATGGLAPAAPDG